MNSVRSFIHSVCLIAGMSIGGGMLALPLQTAQAGFFPTFFLFCLVAVAMITTGFCIAELALTYPEQGHLISLSRATLGKVGKGIGIGSYAFLFYSYVTAYVAALVNLCSQLFPRFFSPLLLAYCFILLLLMVLCGRRRLLYEFNRLLLGGLVITYLMLIQGIVSIQRPLLLHCDWSAASFTLPLIFSAFGYQFVVPTVVRNLQHNRKIIYGAIIAGVGLPFVLYTFWEMTVLGNVPAALLREKPYVTAIAPLSQALENPFLAQISVWFSLFAILSSFLGANLGTIEFFEAHCFSPRCSFIKKVGWMHLVLVPVFCIVMASRSIFLKAIHFGAGLGCLVFFGLLPIAMFLTLAAERRFSRRLLALLAALLLFFCYSLYHAFTSSF